MTDIDDSYLLHAASYDPVKRKEYYERTKHLKGRAKGAGNDSGGGRRAAAPRKATKTQYAHQIAELEKRLARLKVVLAQRVKEAKARSGVETKKTPSSKSTSKTTSKGGSSPSTPQERKKAAEASAEYRKKHPEKKSPQEEIEALRKQIENIRAKIQEAIEDARRQSRRQPNSKTAPKGR